MYEPEPPVGVEPVNDEGIVPPQMVCALLMVLFAMSDCTDTEEVFAIVEPHELIAERVYVPLAEVVMPDIVGLCDADENESGPDQLQLVAPVALPVNVKVLEAQIGLGLAEAVTEVGVPPDVIVIVVVVEAEQPLVPVYE